MKYAFEWVEDYIWVEMEKDGLYPPERITKPIGAHELIKGIDFAGKKVLDVGCGTGWFGRMLKQRGASVFGVDISESLLVEAGKSFPVFDSSAYNLPFENNGFDYAIFFMVAHLLENPAKAFSELKRVLKPESKVFFSIIHPRAERWDVDSGECFTDHLAYPKIAERLWVFNLVDGRKFTKHYFHRPLSFYQNVIHPDFSINRFLEPLFPPSLSKGKKYASREYLFMELKKN